MEPAVKYIDIYIWTGGIPLMGSGVLDSPTPMSLMGVVRFIGWNYLDFFDNFQVVIKEARRDKIPNFELSIECHLN